MTVDSPVNLADTSAIPEDIRNMPWVRAMMMMPELVSRKNEMRKSSVSVLVMRRSRVGVGKGEGGLFFASFFHMAILDYFPDYLLFILTLLGLRHLH